MSHLNASNLTEQTGPKHTATVIFFHGSGSNGGDMKEWIRLIVKDFSFPHIKVVYPTAPLQPYTPAGGQIRNVWFDRAGISIKVPEKLESLSNIEHHVKELIKLENNLGIPSERIVVGGFSMGGALAFHTAYRWDKNLAATFAFSSFLNENSIVYKELGNSAGAQVPPLLQVHGDIDDLVPLSWGQTTNEQLKELGVEGEFHVLERLGHSINRRGMERIRNWIVKHLPEV